MLFTEEKERENRFKLALRMGIPIFSLAVITFTSLLSQYFTQIPHSFITIAISLLGITIYYLFYLIYEGFNERITDPVTNMFTRIYFKKLFDKEVRRKKAYTMLLITIDNLDAINKEYGFSNGDRVLKKTAQQIAEYFEDRGIHRTAICHFKGGDIIVGLHGPKPEHQNVMDLICIKFRHIVIDDIEIDIIGSIADSRFSTQFDILVEHLFDLQNDTRNRQLIDDEEEIDAGDLEQDVIDALNHNRIVSLFQPVFDLHGQKLWYEMSLKLQSRNGKLMHQKSFMPVINRLRMQRQYDLLQFETAIKYSEKIDKAEKIAFPLFANNLRKQYFFEEIFIRLSNNAKLQNRFIFIISETNYYYQREWFDSRIQAYRRAGVWIALDHLGGYHASLRYLNDLDVDVVRFENYLGKNLENTKVQSILKGFQKMSEDLGIKSWIRMIENEETFEIARDIGIDAYQGKHLAKMINIEKESDEIR